jgi:hypothetical protein
MRTCVVHIGTHKTGTTSIQSVMSRLATDLLARGYLYAATGRPPEGPDGHHNLAWEITGDRRFRREYGTLQDLLREADAHSGHVILSSEDFDGAVAHPDGLAAFVGQLQSHGLRVKLVVYLRNQVDYATSLYSTLLDFGLAEPFDSFVQGMLRERQVAWREWAFLFDYDDLVARLERLEHVEIVVRSYDQISEGGLFEDFFAAVGIEAGTLNFDRALRAYRRPLVADLLKAFCRNRRGGFLHPVEGTVIAQLCGSASGSAVGMSAPSTRSVIEAFRESNLNIARRYRFPPLGLPDKLGETVAAVPDALSMELVFSDACVRRLSALGAALSTELSMLAGERDRLATRVSSLELEVGRLNASCAQLAAASEAIRHERDALTGSKSWKATAPLRRLRAWIR